MKQNAAVSEPLVKTSTAEIELCAKAIPVKEQIHNRSTWGVGKVEVLLGGEKDLENLPNILSYTSGMFSTFNVEVGYELDSVTPTDLTQARSQDYIFRVAEICHRFNNFERLVMHLVGGAIVMKQSGGSAEIMHNLPEKFQVLGKVREFLKKLDGKNEFILLENTYPADLNSGGVVVYPCGKVSEDFVDLPRVVDTAHLAISAATYAGVKESGVNSSYGLFNLGEVEVPVFMGGEVSEEREFAKRSKTEGTDAAVLWQLQKSTANVLEVHLCGNYNSGNRQSDGAGFEDNSVINLKNIFQVLKSFHSGHKKLTVIPEIKEQSGDYVTAEKQRRMMNELKAML
ncbi:MAG: hypothetical protein JNN11_04475 [Candidatus Doudnabacteria bacterium]|nr:hypothetical protein [Candidatus Doudnabacteria bacterium]